MFLEHLLNNAPNIIKQAAKNNRGPVVLFIVALAILVIVFFKDESVFVRLLAVIFFVASTILVINKSSSSSTSKIGDESKGVAASQAAAICYRRKGDELEFLLVRSRGGTRRIFPKGNVKEGEALWSAAEREAKEEACVTGLIQRTPLTTYWHRQGGKGQKEWSTAAFLLEVTHKTLERESKRKPMWYSPQKSEKALGKNRNSKDAKELQKVIRVAVDVLTGS